MSIIKWGTLLLLFISFNPTLSQVRELGQLIKGKVRDKTTYQPLEGTNIVLLNSTNQIVTIGTSGPDGEFEIGPVELGRYAVSVSYIGYRTYLNPEILVTASRNIYLDIQLNPGVTTLNEVVVQNSVPEVHINNIGKQPITVEQTLRYASTFFDPARLSTRFPGVSTLNDQNNNIVVRGNSPNGVAWRLEGIDIVNPNHLTNAGTFTDRPVQSGGSVNILSSQLLGTSAFLNGAFDATYGNALSGVFDMKLRNGNQDRVIYTGQLSLIGLDLAVEGPISKAKNGSFIANYRYSTIGLLSAMGVNLGEEDITFQDFSFHLNTTTPKGSTWSVFGIGGKSSNEFIAQRDSTEWEFVKDRQDILFSGGMMGFGVSNQKRISSNSFLNNTIGYSILDNERTSFELDSVYNPVMISYDDNKSEIVTWRSEISAKVLPSASLLAGFHISHLFDEIRSESALLTENSLNGSGDAWLVQPYTDLTHILNHVFSYELGLRYIHHTLSNARSIEPRISLKWNVGKVSSFYLRYGKHSILQRPALYYYYFEDINGNYIYPNEDIGFTKAHHLIAGYNLFPKNRLRLNVEAYYQFLFDVPVDKLASNSFSALNQLEGFVDRVVGISGTGRNYGLDLMLQKTFSNNMYYLANLSLYESKYKGSDGIERDTRFNGRYAFNITGGREFKKMKTSSEKTFGINFSMMYLGGYRDTPIDLTSSLTEGVTVYKEEEAFTVEMDDYFRFDLRLSWSKDRKKYTRTFSIDIQNLTNNKNIAYSYFDREVQDIVVQYQLGIIPILAYRVEF